jgi:mRNA-degrading endonuclease RelE of RelBE toxin-antitoxin system
MHRLDPQEAQRVGRALDRYNETSHGDVVSVKGAGGEKRLRIGDLRLFFKESPDQIDVLAVLPRDKAYRVREGTETRTADVAFASIPIDDEPDDDDFDGGLTEARAETPIPHEEVRRRLLGD